MVVQGKQLLTSKREDDGRELTTEPVIIDPSTGKERLDD